MPLINTSVTNLIQGVSQQPDAVRFSGQCEEQLNALPSVVDGLQKRPSSEFVARISDNSALNQASKVHFIQRDNDERYVVVVNSKNSTSIESTQHSISAFNLETGTQATITERYLGVVDSVEDFGSYVIATLTQKCPVTVASTDAARLGTVRIIEGPSKGTTSYGVLSVASDNERKQVKISGTGIKLYGSDSKESQSVIEYTVTNAPNADLELDERNYLNGLIGSSPDVETLPADDIKMYTTGDVTYVLNTKKTVAKDTTTSSPVSDDALVFIKQGDYDRKYGVTVKTETETYTNWVYSGSSQSIQNSTALFNRPREARSEFILGNLFEGKLGWDPTVAAGGPRYSRPPYGPEFYWDKPLNIVPPQSFINTSVPHLGSAGDAVDNPNYSEFPSLASDTTFTTSLESDSLGVISSTKDFTITVEDSIAGDGIGVAHKSVPNITDLPTVAPHNFKIFIQGDQEAGEDDRYVQFRLNGYKADTPDSRSGEGSWYETSGGNVNNRIDVNTMPLLLKSTGVDTFELGHMPLDKLATGDADTNPDPSFIGSKINGVFQFKGRLGFLSESSVSMSEVKFGSYDIDLQNQNYNFYRTTVTSLLDSDPIDVNVSSDKVTKLRAAVAFQDNLVLFSDFCQFVLKGGQLLTPKSVSVNQITEYDYNKSVEPVAIGSYIYFPFKRGDFTGIREFTINSSTDVFDANEITAHVPQYIPHAVYTGTSLKGGLKSMTGSSAENLMAVADGNDIYVYRYFFRGNEKVVSSWGKFNLSQGDVRAVGFIDSELFIVQALEGSSQTVLLKIQMESKRRDPEGYNTHLDRRVSVTLNATVAEPSFVVPYRLATGETLSVYTKDGLEIQNTVQATEGDTTRVSFANNLVGGGLTGSSEKLYVGLKYTMKYVFSELLFKANAGQLKTQSNGKMRVKNGTLFYEDTGFFEVKVTPYLRDTFTNEFNATVIQGTTEGSLPLDSGSFRFPVFSDPNNTTISIENSTAAPCNLQSAEFESFVHQRSRRYG